MRNRIRKHKLIFIAILGGLFCCLTMSIVGRDRIKDAGMRLSVVPRITSTADQKEYRDIAPEDQIHFDIRGALFRQDEFSDGPSGVFADFGLIDSTGMFLSLKVSDHKFTNGRIRTKMFGDILVKSPRPPFLSYAVTKTQIWKIHKFLVENQLVTSEERRPL